VANIKSAQKRARQAENTMVNKGIVNKNKAARHKSRLNKRVRELSA
jgi:ribosomal protein S20